MGVRRVVTGHSPDGKAVIVSDELVEPVTLSMIPDTGYHLLWGADEAPTFPYDGSLPAHQTYFPPVGGFRFAFFRVPPESAAPSDVDMAAVAAELEEKLPGLLQYVEPNPPWMHTTDTVDFEVVLSGEVWLELDDGAEVHLRAGDTVVQNGTRHAWRNHGSEPAVLAVFMAGARRRC